MIYLLIDDNVPSAKTALSYGQSASLSAVLGNTLTVVVAFVSGGAIVALDSGATGKLVIKPIGSQAGAATLMDAAWTSNGEEGTARRYTFELVADSDAARAILAALESPRNSVQLAASIEWTESAVETRCQDFQFVLHNSSARGVDDVAPDPLDDATWTWLKARLVAGDNITFTDDDNAKTRTIDGSAGGGTVDAASIAAVMHAATAKTTPADNDEVAIVDSAAANGLKKTLWSSIKATLKTYFDTLYDATGAASTAQSTAISTASADATSKANAAQAAAISAASSDATTKANTAQSTAISTASADATTKANAVAATVPVLSVHTDPSYWLVTINGVPSGYLPRIETV